MTTQYRKNDGNLADTGITVDGISIIEPGTDLTGKDLSGAVLTDANLTGADLTGLLGSSSTQFQENQMGYTVTSDTGFMVYQHDEQRVSFPNVLDDWGSYFYWNDGKFYNEDGSEITNEDVPEISNVDVPEDVKVTVPKAGKYMMNLKVISNAYVHGEFNLKSFTVKNTTDTTYGAKSYTQKFKSYEHALPNDESSNMGSLKLGSGLEYIVDLEEGENTIQFLLSLKHGENAYRAFQVTMYHIALTDDSTDSVNFPVTEDIIRNTLTDSNYDATFSNNILTIKRDQITVQKSGGKLLLNNETQLDITISDIHKIHIDDGCTRLISVATEDGEKILQSNNLTEITGSKNLRFIHAPYLFFNQEGITNLEFPNLREISKVDNVGVQGRSNRGIKAIAENMVNLQSISMPKLIIVDTTWEFSGCTSLVKADLREVVYFAREVFRGCVSLKYVKLDNLQTGLEDDNDTFMDCDNLKILYLNNLITNVNGNLFKSIENQENNFYYTPKINSFPSGFKNTLDNTDYSLINDILVGPLGTSWNDFTDTDLTGVNLSGVNLSGIDLSGIDLSSADLTGVSSGSIQSDNQTALPNGYVILNGYIIGPQVDISGADLSGLDLSELDLTGISSGNNTISNETILPTGYFILNGYIIGSGVDFSGMDLSGADLSDIDLSSADLTGVSSGNITSNNQTVLPNGYFILNGYIFGPNVDLTGANFSGMDLSGVDLSGTDLTGVSSGNITSNNETKLPTTHVILNGYIVGPGADLTGADLTGVDTTGLLGSSSTQEQENQMGYSITSDTGYIVYQQDEQRVSFPNILNGWQEYFYWNDGKFYKEDNSEISTDKEVPEDVKVTVPKAGKYMMNLRVISRADAGAEFNLKSFTVNTNTTYNASDYTQKFKAHDGQIPMDEEPAVGTIRTGSGLEYIVDLETGENTMRFVLASNGTQKTNRAFQVTIYNIALTDDNTDSLNFPVTEDIIRNTLTDSNYDATFSNDILTLKRDHTITLNGNTISLDGLLDVDRTQVNKMHIDDGCTRIIAPQGLFDNQDAITEVTGSKNLRFLHAPYLIRNQDGITNLEFPNLREITKRNQIGTVNYQPIFQQMSKLETISMPKLNFIGPTYQFDRCTSLVKADLRDVFWIDGEATFALCDKLKFVRLDNLQSILPNHTFRDCDDLKMLYLPNFIGSLNYLSVAVIDNVSDNFYYAPNYETDQPGFKTTLDGTDYFIVGGILIGPLGTSWDFTDTDLTGDNLSGLDLSGVDLSGADSTGLLGSSSTQHQENQMSYSITSDTGFMVYQHDEQRVSFPNLHNDWSTFFSPEDITVTVPKAGKYMMNIKVISRAYFNGEFNLKSFTVNTNTTYSALNYTQKFRSYSDHLPGDESVNIGGLRTGSGLEYIVDLEAGENTIQFLLSTKYTTLINRVFQVTIYHIALTDDNTNSLNFPVTEDIIRNTLTDSNYDSTFSSNTLTLKRDHTITINGDIISLDGLLDVDRTQVHKIHIDDGCSRIIAPEKLFENQDSITEVTGSKNLRFLHAPYLFYNQDGITNLEFPNLREISKRNQIGQVNQNSNFRMMKGLKSISMPKLNSIETNQQFRGCTVLVEADLREVFCIDGDYCFAYCHMLKFLNLNNVQDFNSGYIFYECRKLKMLYLPNFINYVFNNAVENIDDVANNFYYVPHYNTASDSDYAAKGFKTTLEGTDYRIGGGILMGPLGTSWDDFTDADLTGVNLSGLDLSDVILTGVRSGGITKDENTQLPIGYIFVQDFIIGSSVNLSGEDLSGMDLSGANLTNTNLTNANFTDSQLTNVILDGATLIGTNFTNVDLSGRDFTGYNLTGADLSGIDLSGAILTDAVLSNADLSGSNIVGADLSGATLNGVIWTNLENYKTNDQYDEKVTELGDMTDLKNELETNLAANVDALSNMTDLKNELEINLQANINALSNMTANYDNEVVITTQLTQDKVNLNNTISEKDTKISGLEINLQANVIALSNMTTNYNNEVVITTQLTQDKVGLEQDKVDLNNTISENNTKISQLQTDLTANINIKNGLQVQVDNSPINLDDSSFELSDVLTLVNNILS